ncbi:MAG TPA: phosphatase PAP2 family protein [Nocardioides sp.]|nr:phosphatase PAP2 family protein [Nocardioides sp.]
MPQSAVLERPGVGERVSGRSETLLRDRFPYLPDLCAGLVVFLGFAAFAMSPLGRHIDQLTYLRPLRPGMAGFELVRGCLDHIASQGGEGVVMAALAVAFAVRMRSVLPLLVAGAAEALFYFTGLVKLLFAKDAPRFGAPSYWAGGYVDHGKYGMAFPSGHTSEVVLVFGACVLLLHLAFPAWTAANVRAIKKVWIVVGLNAAVVSWLIGTHWLTDLVGGALFGAVMLRVLVEVSAGFLPAVAGRVDGVLRLRRPSRAVESALRGG